MMPPARCTSSICTSDFDGATLHKHRHAPRQAIDIGHGEINLAFMRGGKKMQNSIGRTAHRDIERHGILEGSKARNRARQNGGIILLIPAPCQIDDEMPRLDEEALAIGMGGEHRAIARQREAQALRSGSSSNWR